MCKDGSGHGAYQVYPYAGEPYPTLLALYLGRSSGATLQQIIILSSFKDFVGARMFSVTEVVWTQVSWVSTSCPTVPCIVRSG